MIGHCTTNFKCLLCFQLRPLLVSSSKRDSIEKTKRHQASLQLRRSLLHCRRANNVFKSKAIYSKASVPNSNGVPRSLAIHVNEVKVLLQNGRWQFDVFFIYICDWILHFHSAYFIALSCQLYLTSRIIFGLDVKLQLMYQCTLTSIF